MEYKVVLSDRAKNDIDDSAAYIFQESKSNDVAQKFINEIYNVIESLSSFPERGNNPRKQILRTQGYKYVICREYLIFYKVLDKTVYVMAVFHSKKDYFRYYKF